MKKESILISGKESYIGQMLLAADEANNFNFIEIDNRTDENDFRQAITDCKYFLHLAQCKEAATKAEYFTKNLTFTRQIINLIEKSCQVTKIIYTSTEYIYDDSAYAESMLKSEEAIRTYGRRHHIHNIIYRLPILMGEKLYLDKNNPLFKLCLAVRNSESAHKIDLTEVFGQNCFSNNMEHKFVDIADVVHELYRAFYGKAFFATVDMSLCVIPCEHIVSWHRVIHLLREIKDRASAFPWQDFGKDSFERKLFKTYMSIDQYYAK